jgi:cytochrome b561
MTDRLRYGTTAKIFHWLIVALLFVQFPIGWLMPDIHRGMKPGDAMTLHISFGILILMLSSCGCSGGSPILSRRKARFLPGSV